MARDEWCESLASNAPLGFVAQRDQWGHWVLDEVAQGHRGLLNVVAHTWLHGDILLNEVGQRH